MLAILFTLLYPLPFIFWLPCLAWAGAVAASRVLLGRHHILDVVAGVLIGAVEAALLSMLWRSEEEVNLKKNTLTTLITSKISVVFRQAHLSMLLLDLRIRGQAVRYLTHKVH